MDPLRSTELTFRGTSHLRKRQPQAGTTVRHQLFRRPIATEALCRACQFYEQPGGAPVGACRHPDCGCWKRPERRNPWVHGIPCPKAGWEPVPANELATILPHLPKPKETGVT